MSIKDVLDWVWTQLNTPSGIALIAAVWSWVMAKLFTSKPKWKQYYDQYKGHMVAAVKYAEKQIPDDTENKSARRADAALQYVIGVIAASQNATPDIGALKQALNVVHDETEL